MRTDRRWFLRAAAAVGGALTGCQKQTKPVEEAEPSRLGKPVSAYGEPSKYVTAKRTYRDTKTPEASSSQTPLQDSQGILTPAGLHFERHHAGVPDIDPAQHKLLIHGMVERPMVLTMDEIRRLPSVSRILFVECSGNSGSEWSQKGAPTAQRSTGLASCSEWTGVSLSLLLAEAGVKPGASWVIAEGADACRMARSLPLKKCLDDVLLAYSQNGEPIRPGQGFPLRLVAPGWEGNICVKWLRQLKVDDQAYQTRDETSHYTDLLEDGTARQFTFEMDAKSIITFPSGGQKLPQPGPYEVTGLAWSGRGRIDKVEVSADGGTTWKAAVLQEPRLPKAFTRFRLPWEWDGKDVTLISRAVDETGYVQPSREDLVAARGKFSQYHNNATKPWKIAADGSVTNA